MEVSVLYDYKQGVYVIENNKSKIGMGFWM